MRLLYGSPPAPSGRNRLDDEALKRLADEMKKTTPKKAPTKEHTFAWRGVKFTWEADCRFEGSTPDWAATVWPDGLRWKAILMLAGGKQEGFAATPPLALDEAVKMWAQATQKLLP